MKGIGTGRSDSRGKITAIQLLRFVAALVVAYSHITFGFARHLASQRGIAFDPVDIPLSRVAMFLLISGCVITLSSRRFYGVNGSWKTFLQRRLGRILPAYWAATVLMAGIVLALGSQVDTVDLLRSLLLLPYWGGGPVPVPVLWPGWTLYLEVLFYLVFAVSLRFSMATCVACASALLLALVGLGYLLPEQSASAFLATRPFMVLLIAGMVLGLLVARGAVLGAGWRVVLAVAGLVLAGLAGVEEGQGAPLGWEQTLRFGLPALLLCVGVAGGPLPLPANWCAPIDRLGDWSYAIFLLHLPVVTFWIRFYPRIMPDPGPVGFVVTCLVLVIALSGVSHTWFERPLTDWLNARLVPAPPPAAVTPPSGD